MTLTLPKMNMASGQSLWISIVSKGRQLILNIHTFNQTFRPNGGVAVHRWFEGVMDDVGADGSLGT